MAPPGRLLISLATGAFGCSYVEVPVPSASAPNGTTFVIGRTMELGNVFGPGNFFGDYFWSTRVHPRNANLGSFGFVSIDGNWPNGSVAFSAEGMNEVGFTASTQTLHGSVYEATEASQGNDVLKDLVLNGLLRNCADVDAAKTWLESHRVVGPTDGQGTHWAIADASGRSLVIEYLEGKRVLYENTPRVMTNDPPLDWHWRNLNTYVNLSPNYPHQNDFLSVDTAVGSVPRAVGHGWNLFGLPGDGSPPSRFVQLFYQRGYAMLRAAPQSVEDAMVLVTGLLNKVFIPFGIAANDGQIAGDSPEYTPWAVLKIPSTKRFLFRGYRNLRWHQVDLTKVDFSPDAAKKTWPIEENGLDIEDVTDAQLRV